MPLDDKTIETTIRLILAHGARYDEIREVGTRLLNPVVYRSKDGAIALGTLTQEDKDRLAARIAELLDEADVIRNNIRQAIAPPP